MTKRDAFYRQNRALASIRVQHVANRIDSAVYRVARVSIEP